MKPLYLTLELTSAQVLEIYNNGRPKDLSTFSGTAPISLVETW